MSDLLDKDYSNSSGLVLTDDAKDSLFTAMRWMRFVTIVGWVLYFLGVLGLLFTLGASRVGNHDDQAIIFLVGFIVYILAFFPLYFAFKSASTGIQAIINVDSQELELSMAFFRRLMTFYGIATIVILSLYGIVLLVALTTILR